jgi:multiple sugar transport system permease protein
MLEGILRRLKDERVTGGYLMLLPSLVIFTIFIFYPVLSSLYLSFTNTSLLYNQSAWIGLDNFKTAFSDPRFINAFNNTLKYTLGVVPGVIAVSLVLALVLDSNIKGKIFFRAAFYLPCIASMVVISLVWVFILDKDLGLISLLMDKLGLEPIAWLRSVTWALPTLVVVSIWKSAGYYMIIFLAGLQGVPEELYEAARIDGASKWNLIRYISLPLLKPAFLFVLTMASIESFQAFAQIYVMTHGGPMYKTEVLVSYIYQKGFQSFDMGYSSAIAFILFLVIMALTIFQLKGFGFFNEEKR